MRLLLILLLLAFAGCSSDPQPPLVAEALEVTPPIPGRRMSAGFMELTNNTSEAMTITHVVCTDYEKVEIHESTVEDGVAKMRRIPELVVPANSSLTLERGGLHLMLMGAAGEPDNVSLSFFDDDMLLLNVSTSIKKKND